MFGERKQDFYEVLLRLSRSSWHAYSTNLYVSSQKPCLTYTKYIDHGSNKSKYFGAKF